MTGTSMPCDDLFQAALERQQVAGAADGAFGEDADHVAGRQFLRAAWRMDSTMSRRTAGATGIALVRRKNQFSAFDLVDTASTP